MATTIANIITEEQTLNLTTSFRFNDKKLFLTLGYKKDQVMLNKQDAFKLAIELLNFANGTELPEHLKK